MFSYDKMVETAAQKLSEYDLTELLSNCYDVDCREPWDIQQQIIAKYPELEDALDWLSNDEFMECLQSKYNVRFEEVISYRMYYTRNKVQFDKEKTDDH